MWKGQAESFGAIVVTVVLVLAVALSTVFWLANRNARRASTQQRPPSHSAPAATHR